MRPGRQDELHNDHLIHIEIDLSTSVQIKCVKKITIIEIFLEP